MECRPNGLPLAVRKTERRKRMNKKQIILIATGFVWMASAFGQQPWSVEQCIKYALNHSREVRQQERLLKDARIRHTQSIGAWLPSVNGSVGGQYNFGRAVDPETNTYTNVNTFYNSYNLQASLPVFEGFTRYYDTKAARARVLMGKQGLQAVKDEVAQQVMKLSMDVLYLQGAVRLAVDKLSESRQLLKQTLTMQEVGTKSEADVAQVQATVAADDYEVTNQQNLLTHAWIALKAQMNFPLTDSLALDTLFLSQSTSLPEEESAQEIFQRAQLYYPALMQSDWEVRAARYSLKAAWGGLFPSLSVGAGISTSFYKTLGQESPLGYRKQMRANRGEYVFATLSIPIFNRLDRLSEIRRQRNEWRKAVDRQQQQQTELQRLILEVLADCESSDRECLKLQKKVTADAWNLRLLTQKYQEGLASGLEVQTASVILLQGQAAWLKSRLMQWYHRQMLNYYKGVPLWIE